MKLMLVAAAATLLFAGSCTNNTGGGKGADTTLTDTTGALIDTTENTTLDSSYRNDTVSVPDSLNNTKPLDQRKNK